MEVKNFNALLITQYETCGTVGRSEYIENYIHEMEISIDMLPAYNEFLANNDCETIESMDFIDDYLSSLNPSEAFSKARASYTQFSYNDDYYSLDGYSNIESYSENQVISMMRQDTNFLEWYIEENNLIDWDEAEKDIQDANELIKAGY